MNTGRSHGNADAVLLEPEASHGGRGADGLGTTARGGENLCRSEAQIAASDNP